MLSSSLLSSSPTPSPHERVALNGKDEERDGYAAEEKGGPPPQEELTLSSSGTTEDLASLRGAGLAVVRCMVGPAALYMPHGVAEAGLGTGLVLVVVATALFYAGISRLLACWSHCVASCQRGDFAPAAAATTAASLAAHLGGAWCRRLVELSVCSLQCGVCVTYFIFVDSTLQRAWPFDSMRRPSTPVVLLVMTALEASAATVRTVQQLTTATLVGNGLVALSLVCIAAVAAARLVECGPASGTRVATTAQGTALFAGTAIFAFEGGASIVVPVANAVHPSNRRHVTGVVFSCVAGVAAAFAAFGAVVYLAYGPHVEVIASQALAPGSWPAHVVNLSYLLVVLLTFPLQLLPATQLLFGDDDLLPSADDDDDDDKGRPLGSASEGNDHEQGLGSDRHTSTAAEHYRNDDDESATVETRPRAADGVGLLQEAPSLAYDIGSFFSSLAQGKGRSATTKRLQGDAKRVTLVVALGFVALVGRSSLDHIIALLGALSCTPLALIVGPWCHLALPTRTPTSTLVDVALIAVGLVVTLLTVALTVATWNQARS